MFWIRSLYLLEVRICMSVLALTVSNNHAVISFVVLAMGVYLGVRMHHTSTIPNSYYYIVYPIAESYFQKDFIFS